MFGTIMAYGVYIKRKVLNLFYYLGFQSQDQIRLKFALYIITRISLSFFTDVFSHLAHICQMLHLYIRLKLRQK